MAEITITGNDFMITSAFTLENLKLIKQYNPDALTEKDEDGRDIFAIGVESSSLSSHGISFNKAAISNGSAFFKEEIPAGVESPKEYVADRIGLTYRKLVKLEKEKLGRAINDIVKMREEIVGNIKIGDETVSGQTPEGGGGI